MSIDVLNLVEGSPALTAGGFLPLGDAVRLSGIAQAELLRACAEGCMSLFCRLGRVPGYLVPATSLEPINPEEGRSGGLNVPSPEHMPSDAVAITIGGVLRVVDSDYVAGVLLAEALSVVELVALEAPNRPGWFFAPDVVVRRDVVALELPAAEVEAMRAHLAAAVSPERLEHARAARKAKTKGRAVPEGKWAEKLFSHAVAEYCSRSDGLRASLASDQEQGQRKKGMLLFSEFMGDLQLGAIDSDKLREFREGPLKTLPSKVNNLPKEVKRETMRQTIAALKADGREWPLMSRDMQRERMLWLFRLFGWLCEKGYLTLNPSTPLRDETGMTKAEHKTLAREIDPEDEGRGPFSEDELKAIFSVGHYKTGRGDHVKGYERWYPFQFWLPLLGLFAGCRIKEASQLHLSDVKQVASGAWVLDINQKTEDKTLKNKHSVRIVPLHPRLEELGFIKYCERLRGAGYQRVFPELTYAKSDARYAKESIRKMSAMLKKLGMPRDLMHVFHCLRHNMNNALARVPMETLPYADEGLKKYIRYRIIGHKPGDDVNVRHYTSTSPEEMAALVGGLTYELPTIAAFDIEFGLERVTFALTNKKAWRKGKEDMGPLNSDKSSS